MAKVRPRRGHATRVTRPRDFLRTGRALAVQERRVAPSVWMRTDSARQRMGGRASPIGQTPRRPAMFGQQVGRHGSRAVPHE